MINTYQEGFLKIVRSALTEEKFNIPDDFNFQQACITAYNCNISSILYYGAINCGISPEKQEMQQLFSEVCRYILISQRQNYQINCITAAFEENGIDYMLLKGGNIRKLYLKPEMRIMGDADILIRIEQYDLIKSVMKQIGLTECYESDHEYVWSNKNLLVELHKKLIPSYNKDYYSYYSDGWSFTKQSSKHQNCFEFSPEDELIYIFTHFAEHYRSTGAELRSMIDMWVFREKNKNLDEKYIYEELKKLNLEDFYTNVLYTLDVWFKDASSNEITDIITNSVLSHNPCNKKEIYLISEAAKLSNGSVKSGKTRKLLRMVFTPFKPLSDLYPILKKVPVLLPFAWVYHWFDVFINRRANITKRNNERKLLSESRISEYYNSLKKVGLDYNLEK